MLYELHELLRQYAAERLAALGLADDARQRHGRYYAALLDNFAPLLVAGDTQVATLRRMQSQIDNIRTAWEWALTARDGAGLNQMLNSFYYFYNLPALVRDGRVIMAAAATQLAPHETLTDNLRLAYRQILDKQASFTWPLHEDYAARREKLARASLAVWRPKPLESRWRAPPERPGLQCLCGRHCGCAHLLAPQPGYLRTDGQSRAPGNILRNLCVTAPTLAASRRYWERAIALMRDAGNQRDEGHLYFVRGDREAQAGHYEPGRDLLQRGLGLIRRFEDPPHLLMALSALAELHTEQGKVAAARALVAEMVALGDRMAIEWHSVLVTLSQANLALAENRLVEAAAFLEEALAKARMRARIVSIDTMPFSTSGGSTWPAGVRGGPQDVAGVRRTDGRVGFPLQWAARPAGIGETWLAIDNLEAAAPFLRQAADVATAIGAEAAWAAAGSGSWWLTARICPTWRRYVAGSTVMNPAGAAE